MLGGVETRTLIESYLQAREAGDAARIAELTTDDVEYLVPPGLGVAPRYGEVAVEALAGAAAARAFDLATIKRELKRITVGDDVALVEERMTAKALNGADYDNEYVWVLELRDGRIARVTEFVDTLYAARTLGIFD